ncbi:MAG: rhomboid family intramembrane serine protease [Candidatus Eisenbacteria bacterium]
MTRIRIGETQIDIPDESWEMWVRSGRIPADAWVLSPVWTQGVWRLADTLEVYHLYLPAPRPVPRARAPGLAATIFPRGGLSMTEMLVLANTVVIAVLYLVWKGAYEEHLFWFARFLRTFVGSGKGFFAALVPMFLHAGPQHFFFNMVSLVASGAVVEYFYGRWKLLFAYILSGYGGAALSLYLRPKPVLSVGASGAIFGLYGVTLVFLLLHSRRFTPRQRWKAARVYLPLMLIATVPAIFGADLFAHVGGFLTGCAVALFLHPGSRAAVLFEERRDGEEAAAS